MPLKATTTLAFGAGQAISTWYLIKKKRGVSRGIKIQDTRRQRKKLHADPELAPSLEKLRDLRLAAQNNHTPAAGAVLAGGLLSYSERGEAYIEELRTMIRINNLSQFDQGNLDPAP